MMAAWMWVMSSFLRNWLRPMGARAIVEDAADGAVQPRHSVHGPWLEVPGVAGVEAVFNQ